MKVKVLQVEDATFKSKFSRWSNWIDIAVFNYGDGSYLIQMQVSRANAKRFKSVSTTGGNIPSAHCNEIGDLMPINSSPTP